MIPYYDGRVGPGLKVLGQRTSDEDYSKILTSLKRPHMDYLHDFYADTAMFGGGVRATRCGFEFSASIRSFSRPTRRSGRSRRPLLRSKSWSLVRRMSERFCGNAEKLLNMQFG